MAKANRHAIPILKNVKLDTPSREDERVLHHTLGFRYGLEYVDELISYHLSNQAFPSDYFAMEICKTLRSTHVNNTFAQGFLEAFVTLLCKLNHASTAAVREARALDRAASNPMAVRSGLKV
jgi:hypothetical protein